MAKYNLLTESLRARATSILAAIQELEDTKPHESWSPDDVATEIGEALLRLKRADDEIWGTVLDLRDPFIA